jgi:hypothetical protein
LTIFAGIGKGEEETVVERSNVGELVWLDSAWSTGVAALSLPLPPQAVRPILPVISMALKENESLDTRESFVIVIRQVAALRKNDLSCESEKRSILSSNFHTLAFWLPHIFVK